MNEKQSAIVKFDNSTDAKLALSGNYYVVKFFIGLNRFIIDQEGRELKVAFIGV
jgi:hypothetical protein